MKYIFTCTEKICGALILDGWQPGTALGAVGRHGDRVTPSAPELYYGGGAEEEKKNR